MSPARAIARPLALTSSAIWSGCAGYVRGGGRSDRRPAGATRGRRGRPAGRRAGGPAEEADALLVSLPDDAQLPAPQVEVGHLGAGQLRDAQPCRVGRLPEGAVALGERARQRAAGTRAAITSGRAGRGGE